MPSSPSSTRRPASPFRGRPRRKASSSSKSSRVRGTCPICLERFNKTTRRPVRLHASLGPRQPEHRACRACRARLLQTSAAPRCPLCRAPIRTRAMAAAAASPRSPPAPPRIVRQNAGQTYEDITTSLLAPLSEHDDNDLGRLFAS